MKSKNFFVWGERPLKFACAVSRQTNGKAMDRRLSGNGGCGSNQNLSGTCVIEAKPLTWGIEPAQP